VDYSVAHLPRKASQEYTNSMLEVYSKVKATGLPNYIKARVQLPTNFNFDAWERHTRDYADKQVVDFLKFGFPTSYYGPVPDPTADNHASALQHPRQVDKYTTTETAAGAMLGPFKEPPFVPWCQTNPLMSRPKKDSSDRRIIMDLSWPKPPGHSVNGGTSKELYLGVPYKLQLPHVDDFVKRIVQQGRGSLMYSTDVARAFRQIPEDPACYPLTCCKTSQGYFIDLSLPFGLRWAAACCQRVTDVVSHILNRNNHCVLNYIDDFAGVAASATTAHEGFKLLQGTLAELGIQEARHKATPPSDVMTWIGFRFSSTDMTVSLPPSKLAEITQLVHEWAAKPRATLKQLQCILGKLFHVAQVCKPARLFVGRMLATLRRCPPSGHIELDVDFRRDIEWFARYLPSTNGVYMLEPSSPEPITIKVDSCTSGCGGVALDQCYHAKYPEVIMQQQLEICHLEMLNVLVALRLWAPRLANRHVQMLSDSMVAIAVLQAGSGRDPFLLQCAREVWLLCATHTIDIKCHHIPGLQLTDSADALSRMHLGEAYRKRVAQLLSSSSLSLIPVPLHCFELSSSV
jgi:hypothetical protein